MARELAFALINPYTIAKSRTGGVIARFIGRTNLDLVAARMFGPSMDLVGHYSESLRHAPSSRPETCRLLADYVLKHYAPDPKTGRPRRVIMLLFEGEDAVRKVWEATGSSTLRDGSGETIRDTYGDYIVDEKGRVQYFEPAVLVAPTKQRAALTLSLWAKYAEKDGGIIESGADVPHGANVQMTLVLLKPDNFRVPSFRPGRIIDLLSASNLRIVGIKKFCMTVAQAEQFYGPVQSGLQNRFPEIGLRRAADALAREFGFEVPEAAVRALCTQLSPAFAHQQFEEIVHFMTGYRPSECTESEKATLGKEGCLALLYEGVDAVAKIRSIIGSTDPRKASSGTVRKEFGSDVMVNAAHASDSPENARREMQIVNIQEDTIRDWVDPYYGGMFGRLRAQCGSLPKATGALARKLRLLWQGDA